MAQQKQDPAAFGLDLAIQQAGVAAALFSQAVQRALAERDTRIAELEKLCGDPCKAKVQETK
jgi:hypothetical protein